MQFHWTVDGLEPSVDAFASGELQALELLSLERQQRQIEHALQAYAHFGFVQHMLLYGARGCGKTTLLKQSLQRIDSPQLTIAWLASYQLSAINEVCAKAAAQNTPRCIIAVDDVRAEAVQSNELEFLRLLLEPQMSPFPSTMICVTSNRRQLTQVTASEVSDDLRLQPRSEKDARLSLMDRFHLSVGFAPMTQTTYLECCRYYWRDIAAHPERWVQDIDKEGVSALRSQLEHTEIGEKFSLDWLNQRQQHPCGRAALQCARALFGVVLGEIASTIEDG